MKSRPRKVPDVARRRRISASAIRRLVDNIVERFAPRRVILFGNYARETQQPEGDVELMVVMDTANETRQSSLIRQAVPCTFGLDLIVCAPKSFEQRLALGDFFLRGIVEQGKVMYESTDR